MPASKLRALLLSTYELGRQPFGIASPAAWLRNSGFAVQCRDLAVEPIEDELFESADLVAFFLPMHTAARLALPLITRARAINRDLYLSCYGLYAPPNATYLCSLGVDSVLGGEFEQGLLDLCGWIARGKPGANEIPEVSLALQQFQVPDRHDLPALSEYGKLQYPDGSLVEVGYTEASRGCKHHCRHCPVVPIYNGRFRVVQQEVVLADIRQQVESGARHITFGDPDFFNGIGHSMPLVERLHCEFPEVTYDVTIKVEHLLKHRDRLPVLRATGCVLVTSAVESTNDHVLQLLRKGHTRQDFIRAARLCNEMELGLNPTFVPFTPWSSIADYRDLLATIVDLDLVAQVAPVQLTIRLLIPQGSRLLGCAETRGAIGRFDPEQLSYLWGHPDQGLDELYGSVYKAVCKGVEEDRSRVEIFADVWRLAHEMEDQPTALPSAVHVPPPATIPFMTEPWYC
jgi:radical SAM superfamily enzyme YgiQ (UPF0313 family)